MYFFFILAKVKGIVNDNNVVTILSPVSHMGLISAVSIAVPNSI